MVNKYTYLEIFLSDPNQIVTLSEMESYYKTPHQTVKRHISPLIKQKVINEDKRKRFLNYKLNLKNPVTLDYISICEKQRLFEFISKPLFKRLYELLASHFKNNKILIFGSAVSCKSFSDIDLLIISNDKKINKTIQDFSTTYKKIHPIQTNRKNINASLLEEIKKNHIIFNEHDYFVRLLYGED